MSHNFQDGSNNDDFVLLFDPIKRNLDVQLASTLGKDNNYIAKAMKLKRLQSKVGYISGFEFSYNMLIFQFVFCYENLRFNLFCSHMEFFDLYNICLS